MQLSLIPISAMVDAIDQTNNESEGSCNDSLVNGTKKELDIHIQKKVCNKCHTYSGVHKNNVLLPMDWIFWKSPNGMVGIPSQDIIDPP